jgi:hypothetical protein
MRIEKTTKRAQHAPQAVTGAARTAATIFLMLSGLMLAAGAVMAQTSGADAPPPPAAASPPANPAAPPQPQSAAGAFGNWVMQGGTWMQQSGQLMQQGVANMGAGFGQAVGAIGGQANQATRDAADAARNAATSVSKLPNAGVTAGSERCVIAPNGAPDCVGAAEKLCRAKGYAGGSSVDFITVENCPPPWRISRRNAPEGVCSMEHYVTKALCQ